MTRSGNREGKGTKRRVPAEEKGTDAKRKGENMGNNLVHSSKRRSSAEAAIEAHQSINLTFMLEYMFLQSYSMVIFTVLLYFRLEKCRL